SAIARQTRRTGTASHDSRCLRPCTSGLVTNLTARSKMFDSFAQLFPAQWQGAVILLTAPLRWLAQWQPAMLSSLINVHPAARVFTWVVLLVPVLVLMAGAWCTAASLYTLPFRSGRGHFLTALLMTWWDAARCIWLFWTGMLRVGIAIVGWVIGSVRFGLLMLKNILLGIVRSPLTL